MAAPMRHYTYREKMAQVNREAKATLVVLALTVIVWIALGFGLSGLDIQLFHTPIWVFGGTVGVWIFSIVAVVVLRTFVFQDFDLGDEEEGEGERHE